MPLADVQVDSSISQLYPDSWQAAQAGSWSRYQIATTVRRDNESSSSSIYAAAHPGDSLLLANISPQYLVIIHCFLVE